MTAGHRPAHFGYARKRTTLRRFGPVTASLIVLSIALVQQANSDDRAKSNLILGNLPPAETSSTRGGATFDGASESRLAQIGNGFSVADARGTPGTPIPLKISLPSPMLDEYTFVMLRGLSKAFKLSAGFQTKDAWAVSLRDLPGLSLIGPPDFTGVVEVEVLLIKGREVAPETRKLTVTISRQGAPDSLTADVTGSEVRTAAPPFDPLGMKEDTDEEKTGLVMPPKGLSEAEETAMLSRANQILKNSDVSAARLLFEHIAGRGSAKGAFAMGQTYDPEFLSTLFVKGLKADVEKAKAWYRRSIELGGGEAQARLSALDAQK